MILEVRAACIRRILMRLEATVLIFMYFFFVSVSIISEHKTICGIHKISYTSGSIFANSQVQQRFFQLSPHVPTEAFVDDRQDKGFEHLE